ncbi:NAD-dependent succinate-semialdehyde dehydrogenase [Sphingosinicella sp. BN140058]|uniref:NAD-dependent succinate-semialdehyde dehydrogenase n=1 Tax=Sphingosinicella sp. BN140058 TaxID=1892855 RepID=UPI001011BF7E|nr:NAD-dependent succinate-semialdehyde dehydrogenase [Sphingosinicella sp. BN140058]QAY79492.1 NAD-dependent succinate-semialdehyde dehydrogenase [Sphingosinicella sp. BN140058]
MFRSVNPATGEEIATYPELEDDALEAKLASAASAYRHWRTTSLAERTALLSRIADRFEANRERLARVATLEMGKTFSSALAEVDKCTAAFRLYAKDGPEMLAPQQQKLGNGGTAELHWLPIGPVLAIMPWNFPFWQAVRFIAPAIMAGNVGLLKHASIVQGVAGLLEEMVMEAGAPQGLFQNLAVKSSKISEIIADDRIAAVTLTGSEGAGASVAQAAGKALKKVVLELGGSDPFIVMPSADLDAAAAQAVKARIQNTGQSCICAKRMIVHRDIYDSFMARFSAGMQKVKAGDPFDESTDMGPLSSAEQRDTILQQLAEAKSVGATLLFGGETLEGPGAYLSAGILTEVPLHSPLMHEEIFGPIAMVFRADDIDDAIRIANDIPFGLGSSVWTNDAAEQRRFVRDIEAGMTAINQMLASAPEAPFGGIKRSGYGRELGPFGMHEFMNLKSILHVAGAPLGARTDALD